MNRCQNVARIVGPATLLVTLMGSGACTGHGAPAKRLAPATYLVWDFESRAPVSESDRVDPLASDRVPFTRWVTRDTDGSVRELGRRAGLWVVADDTVWRMGRGTKTWTSATCDALNDVPGGADRATHTSRSVDFDARDGRTRDVIKALSTAPGYEPDTPPDEVYVGDYTEHHAPIAGIDAIIIFRSTTYSYECGAHGGVESSFVAFDLDHGTREDLLGAARELGEAKKHTAQVRADLIARDAWEDGDIELTAVYPRVVDERLETRFQYSTGACYACSDGAWNSYSVSTEIVSDNLPASLRAHATPPPVVVESLVGVDQQRGFGWSAVPSAGKAYDEVAEVFAAISD